MAVRDGGDGGEGGEGGAGEGGEGSAGGGGGAGGGVEERARVAGVVETGVAVNEVG